MQEKFIRKTMKRIAAVGAGVAMVGATMTGALAYSLADYPAPFVVSGTYDDSNVFVVGDNALAADSLGVLDIGTGLQAESKVAVTSDSTTVSVEGATAEKVPLKSGLTNNSLFDTALQDDDVSNLYDGEINFQSKSYDTSEELQMTTRTDPTMATSLTSSDDDYKSDVYLEVNARDMIKFAYKFDEAVNISLATAADPLQISFLGDPLKITSVPSTGDRFTAYVGDEHYMTAGDTLEVEIAGVTKVVTLTDVSSTSAVIDVDGTSKIIGDGSTSTVNGVEITVDDVFSRTERAESSANLVIGAVSSETYVDGDAYIGENVDEPDWVWNLEGLATSGTGQNITLENDFVYNDVDSGALVVGECINLPNDYVQICYDSLTVADADYATYTFEYENSVDVSQPLGSTNSSITGIRVSTTASEGIELLAYTTSATHVANTTSTVRVKELWLVTPATAGYANGSGGGTTNHPNNKFIGVFYKDSADSKVKLFGQVNCTSNGAEIFRINYGNTKDTNIILQTYPEVADTMPDNNLTFVLDIVGDDATNDLQSEADDIYMSWGLSDANGSFLKLGGTASTEEATELRWSNAITSIGTKDEDHRTAYGIIIKNPKSNGASEQVELSIPQDQVKANIVIKGTSSTVTGGDTTYSTVPISPVSKTVSELSDPSAYNLILVGGPCANTLVEDLFSMTCEGWSFQEGEAVVKLVDNGDKVALLVAGTSADDTRRAAKALANYGDYSFTGAEALVTGTSLTDIDVSAVTA